MGRFTVNVTLFCDRYVKTLRLN